MSLCVCDGCVTLPAEVETVLGVNQGGIPTLMRDQWFEYHANGTGNTCYVPWGYTQNMGYVSTFKEPSTEVMLVAVSESPLDNNKTLRVFGWDTNGKRIYTDSGAGVLQDGFLVPVIYGFPTNNPSAALIARIDRVQKDVTNAFIRLIAVNQDGTPNTTIGYYQPWETNPNYVRMKVHDRNFLRIKYRKKNLEVRSAGDWINIDNREALILAIKAVKYRRQNQLDLAKTLETEAVRILSDEAKAKRPPGIDPPQIVFNDGLPVAEYDALTYIY